MRQDIELSAEDGTVLRGYLHVPERVRAPAIVMAHGFSGVKEQIDHYAAAFCAAGFVVLVYDHRSFGCSGGSPRHELNPMRQVEDWRDAITFMLARPEVDAGAGVGVWGSSFAGGLAMVIAANDRRVRCVVAQIPNVLSHRNARELFNVEQRAQLSRAFADDRVSRLAGAKPAMVPVFTSEPNALCALPPGVSERYIKGAEAQFPTWSNHVTLRSLENSLQFEPAGWAPYVSPTPLLMIVGENDTCTFPKLQLEVFALAKEPKKLVVHPGGHFDTYKEHFTQTSEAATSWFATHLR